MGDYWEQRFSSEGMIWGKSPSRTAYHALEIFREHHVQSVLVPGSGYGRNTKAFSSIFDVEGLEISTEALAIAEEWDPDSRFIQGSCLEPILPNNTYDAVYCFDVLHLFLAKERKQLIENCLHHLNPSGLVYFTCFSDQDKNYGVGPKIEEGTYEYIEGKYAHFFSEKDLLQHFSQLQILETGSCKEILNYNDHSTKEYHLRYIVGRKMQKVNHDEP